MDEDAYENMDKERMMGAKMEYYKIFGLKYNNY